MDLEDRFKEKVDEWKKHCESVKLSSNSGKYLDCQAYRDIVNMGDSALYLIREIYSGKDEDAFFPILGWASAVYQITKGDFTIPVDLNGDVHKVREWTIGYLDTYFKMDDLLWPLDEY